MKILVIEDDPVIRNEIIEWLTLSSFEAISAQNGREGVEKARSYLPAMIISDIMMPELTGYDVLRQLQTIPATALIPFIFLSALTDKDSIRMGMNLGADDYLTKPFSFDEFMTTVRVRLSKHAAALKFVVDNTLHAHPASSENSSISDMLTGSIINGYQFGAKLGEGSVYKAYQPALGREVAVKVLRGEDLQNAEVIRRFEILMGLISNLEHPHIIPVYDHWHDDTGLYIVMRLLRAGSLQEMIVRHGTIGITPTANMLDQIADALYAAHQIGIVHRNLKPANILLDERGNAYITDFGFSRNLVSGVIDRQTGDEVYAALHTQNASAVQPAGNLHHAAHPAYQSPEQIRLEPIAAQSDIYSLGIILYEMLLGTHPFQGTIEEIKSKHLQEMLPNIHIQNPQILHTMDAVIQKAAAKDWQERYADVRHLAAEFRRAARQAVSAAHTTWNS
jgi:CheY-like chemotaxis protein